MTYSRVPGRRTLRTVESFPATVTITAAEAAELFGRMPADLRANDRFEVFFSLNLDDGRVINTWNELVCRTTTYGRCSVNWIARNP